MRRRIAKQCRLREARIRFGRREVAIEAAVQTIAQTNLLHRYVSSSAMVEDTRDISCREVTRSRYIRKHMRMNPALVALQIRILRQRHSESVLCLGDISNHTKSIELITSRTTLDARCRTTMSLDLYPSCV